MAKLSAFADEVTDDFLEQVKYLAGKKVDYIEPCSIRKKDCKRYCRRAKLGFSEN